MRSDESSPPASSVTVIIVPSLHSPHINAFFACVAILEQIFIDFLLEQCPAWLAESTAGERGFSSWLWWLILLSQLSCQCCAEDPEMPTLQCFHGIPIYVFCPIWNLSVNFSVIYRTMSYLLDDIWICAFVGEGRISSKFIPSLGTVTQPYRWWHSLHPLEFSLHLSR